MFESLAATLGLGTTVHRTPNRNDYETLASPTIDHSIIDDGHSVHTRRRSRSRSLVGEAEPDDKLKWAHYVLGAACLLSWNAMITATPYFESRMVGSSLKSAFTSYLSATYTLSGFIALAHATITSGTASSSKRIHVSLLTLLCLLSFIAITPFFSLSPNVFFVIAIFSGILQASASSYLQTAVVALASLFGPFAIQAVFAGQAAVAVLVSALQFTTSFLSYTRHPPGPAEPQGLNKGPEDANVATSAFFFFAISSAFAAVAIGVHIWLVRLPTYKAVVNPFEISRTGLLVEEEEEELPDADDFPRSPEEERYLVGVEVPAPPPQRVTVWRVGKLNAMYNLAVGYVFVVTLAVFPPITTSIRSVHASPDASPLFSPLVFNSLHFLLYNLSDYLGRYLCTLPLFFVWSRRKLLALSLLRTGFIPLFLACNIQRPAAAPLPTLDQVANSPIINSDIIYLGILFVFGLSNGYVSTLCMISASSIQHNVRLKKEQVDTAATVAQFCLTGGLVIGSVASFAVRARICQCNPFLS